MVRKPTKYDKGRWKLHTDHISPRVACPLCGRVVKTTFMGDEDRRAAGLRESIVRMYSHKRPDGSPCKARPSAAQALRDGLVVPTYDPSQHGRTAKRGIPYAAASP